MRRHPRRSHGIFKSRIYFRISRIRARGLLPRAAEGAQHRASPVQPCILRLGRARLCISDDCDDNRRLHLRLHHRARSRFKAEAGEGHAYRLDRDKSCASRRIQVLRFLCRDAQFAARQGSFPHARADAADRNIVLHVPGALLRHRRIPPRRARSEEHRRIRHIRYALSAAYRGTDRPLRRR